MRITQRCNISDNEIVHSLTFKSLFVEVVASNKVLNKNGCGI